MLQRRAEEFSLTQRGDTGNKKDHSGMQRFLSMENKKVGAIVRYKRMVLLADSCHESPIFGTTETEIVDMIGHVTGCMR
jgi:hypothetical protein